jgi:hypothetical protein
MTSNVYNFTINQGETFSKLITWRDSAGALINLTGYTARMDLRRKATDTTSLLSLTTANSRIVLGGALGTITLAISATETALLTGVYVYDLEMVNGSNVKRLLQGQIEIDLEVTK